MSDWRTWPATAALALVTALVSLWLIVAGTLPTVAIEGGFTPARLGRAAIDQGFALPVWVTPLTATLIHGGFAHLALNLVMLVFCGRQVERVLGSGAVLVLYAVGAYAATLGQWALSPGSAVPMIGASGAISALIAAYARFFGERRARRVGPFSADAVHVMWLAAAWIGIQLLMGVAGMGGLTIAIGAHIGGFVTGLLLALPLLRWRYRRA